MNFAERTLARLTDNNIQEAMRVAARDVIPDMADRIFDKGQNSTGGDIGRYSTNPLSILKTDMPRVVSGTRSSTKSVFFQGGYAQFKRELGYDNVNWRVFGNLMRDFLSPKETVNGRSITYTVKRNDNQEKLNDLTNKYGKTVTDLSTKESETVSRVFNFELAKRLFQE